MGSPARLRAFRSARALTLVAVAAIALAALVAVPCAAFAAPTVTTLASDAGGGVVSDNLAAYSKYEGGVFVRDLVTNKETKISDDPIVVGMAIDKGRVAWMSVDDASESVSLEFYDTTAAAPSQQRIATDVGGITSAAISGDRIVFWKDDPETFFSTLYVYKISTKATTRLTTDTTSQYSAAISGNRVVWTDELDGSEGFTRDIRMRDLVTNVTSTLTTNTAQGFDHWWADIDGDRVVWQEADQNADDYVVRIVAFDLKTMKGTAISPATYNGKVPKVSGNRVIWEADIGEMASPEFKTAIDAYDFTTGKVERLQDGGGTSYLFDPEISGNRAVWYASDPDRVMLATWSNATPPKVNKAAFANAIAYELKSFLTTQFVVNTDKAGVTAKLTIKTATGDVQLFNGTLANAAGVDYKLPAWNGLVAGKRLPSAAYDWTLTLTKDGVSTTKTGKVTISKILFTCAGTSAAGAAKTHTGYMVPGNANCYVSARTTAGSDTLTVKLTGPYGFSLPSRYWGFTAAAPLSTTSYFKDASAIKCRAVHTFTITGKTNATYSMTVIQ